MRPCNEQNQGLSFSLVAFIECVFFLQLFNCTVIFRRRQCLAAKYALTTIDKGLLECFFVFSLNQTAEYATDDQTLIKKLSCCWWLNPTLILTTFTIRVVSFVSSSLTVSNEGSFRGKSNKFHLNPSKSKLSHCTGG